MTVIPCSASFVTIGIAVMSWPCLEAVGVGMVDGYLSVMEPVDRPA